MGKPYLLLIFSFFTLSGFSQEDFLLKGEIFADSLQGSKIHIINTTQVTGTTNESSGKFKIPVKEGDVLWFTSVQYEKVEITVDKQHLQDGVLHVDLITMVNELDEVKISNTGLSGNLERDLSGIKMFNK